MMRPGTTSPHSLSQHRFWFRNSPSAVTSKICLGSETLQVVTRRSLPALALAGAWTHRRAFTVERTRTLLLLIHSMVHHWFTWPLHTSMRRLFWIPRMSTEMATHRLPMARISTPVHRQD